MKLLKVAPPSLKQRPDSGGTLGRNIPLKVNHFPLAMHNGNVTVQQYHVDCSSARSAKLNKEETRQVFWKVVADQKNVFVSPFGTAFDGSKCAYTIGMLMFPSGLSEHTFEVELQLERDERPSKYSVNMQHVGSVFVDLRSCVEEALERTPIHVIEIVCRQVRLCPYGSNGEGVEFVPAGHSFYNQCQADPRLDLGLGRQIWSGYYCAAQVVSNWKPVIVLDTSNTAFYKAQSALEFMCEVLNGSMAQPGGGRGGGNRGAAINNAYNVHSIQASTKLQVSERRAFEKEIKGLQIIISYHSNDGSIRSYRVNGVTEEPALDKMFKLKGPDDQEKNISVAEYFVQRYNYRLKYPNLPCLHVGPKNRSIFLPVEACSLRWGQKCNKKLSEDMTTTMIKYACIDAPTRQRRIEENLQVSGLCRDKFLENFGFKLDGNMLRLIGRVLEAPHIEYNQQQKAIPRYGVWQMRSGMQFVRGAECRCWAFISFLRRDKQADMEQFCKQLSSTANFMGCKMAQWPEFVEYLNRTEEIQPCLQKMSKEAEVRGKKLQLVVVALSQKNTLFYSEVKRVSEIECGMMTQCVIAKNIFNAKPQTLANIALKINAKLGGINSQLTAHPELSRLIVGAQTLFVGIDLTHPGPTDTRSPSIAAVVANIDTVPSAFATSVCVQKQRRDTIVNLQGAMRERILAFYKNTKQKPARIIVYRDGVSNSQFHEVLGQEMMGIRAACQSLSEDYKPPITFIVVQKRHHTRLFCENSSDTCGKSRNVPPGTTVDQVCVHPTNFDFYMVAHYGIQGTSRPSHFCALHDDSELSSNQLQLLTFYLCHIYVRCMRSVSVPAPVYYAALACTRARYHLVKLLGDFSGDGQSTHSVGDESLTSQISESELQQHVTVKEHFFTSMYFV